MRFTHSAASRQQFRFLQRQFLQDGDLPFTNVLTQESISQALSAIKVAWKERVYTPLVTLWAFLGQILSADHSCRAAVARLIAYRCSQGLTPCSPDIWTHILAYNLIRTMMAQAAVCHNVEPRSISFKGAKQTLEAFQPVIALQSDARQLENLYGHLLTAIAYHRVPDSLHQMCNSLPQIALPRRKTSLKRALSRAP